MAKKNLEKTRKTEEESTLKKLQEINQRFRNLGRKNDVEGPGIMVDVKGRCGFDVLDNHTLLEENFRKDTYFHSAYQELTAEEKIELNQLSDRGLDVLIHIDEGDLSFRFGKAGKAHNFPVQGYSSKLCVPVNLSNGPNFDELMMFVPIWESVEKGLNTHNGINRKPIQPGLVIKDWRSSYDINTSNPMADDPGSTYHEPAYVGLYFDKAAIVADGEKSRFVAYVNSAYEATRGVKDFKEWLTSEAVPRGNPFIYEVRYILSEGYSRYEANIKKQKAKEEAKREKKSINKLEGEEI